MRLALLAALSLTASACIVVEHPAAPPPRAYAVPPAAPAPPSAPAAPASPAQARPGIGERDAVARAFDYARDRGLEVDRVQEARLDPKGRWLVELRGKGGDRARMIIDAQDGRLLRGRFRETDAEIDD
jgi:hypothetical protein